MNGMAVIEAKELVFVIDHDPSMRNTVKRILGTVGLETRLFASARQFLDAPRPDVPSCLVLDVRLPGISGLDLQKELLNTNTQIPIIFITAHGDIPMAVRAIKAGAVEFFTKPFRDQDLLDAIQLSLAQDQIRRQKARAHAELEKRLHSLTARERQVLPLVVSGRSNKEVAAEIGKSEITVKVHRGNLMRKMQAGTFAELLRMAGELKIGGPG